MPPQENQGDLPEQPNQAKQPLEQPSLPTQPLTGQGQSTTQPEQSTASQASSNLSPVAGPTPVATTPGAATPASPASPNPHAGEPASTSPVGTPAAAVPTETPHKNPLGKHKKLIGIIVAVIIILVLAALLLPFSPFAILKGIPKGPKMMVGDKNRFVYACSVFDADTVGKELGLNQDKSKQSVEESLSFDPSNVKDKSVNLIKQTGETSVDSSCKLKFDRAVTTGSDGEQTTSFINVSAFIQQFPDEKEASYKFDQAKKALGSNAKTLASYGDSSFYVTPVTPKSGPTYVQPVVKYKNLLIYFTAPLKADDQAAEKMVGQLDKVTKDVLKRIDAKQGDSPKNFSGVAKIGKNKFVDVCQSVNYQKFAQAMGGDVQFEPTSFTATQNYAPEDNNGKSPKHLLSMCSFDFRTKSEADALASQRPENLLPTEDNADEESPYRSHYPHFALVQILTAENKEGAQKLLTDFKKTGESQPDAPKIEDVKIGDTAFKVDSPHGDNNPYDNRFYYIAKGSHTYLISISYKRQSQPFKTTDQSFSDDQAKQMLDLLAAGSSYAQKK